jgi:hypothetical protein
MKPQGAQGAKGKLTSNIQRSTSNVECSQFFNPQSEFQNPKCVDSDFFFLLVSLCVLCVFAVKY